MAMNMELDLLRFKGDPMGLQIADEINTHLPLSIRVFSVVKVPRKFTPRVQCAVRY